MPKRNDPCPCGSGKKYKKCCGAPPRVDDIPVQERARERAIEWLRVHHRRGFKETLEELLEDLAGVEPGPDVEGVQELIFAAFQDDLLAEGDLATKKGRSRVPELLLGPGGPLFLPEERAWIEALAGTPVGLYEVTAAVPGDGVELQDSFDPEAEPIWVPDGPASRIFEPLDLLGARIIEVEGLFEIASLYDFRGFDLEMICEALRSTAGPEPRQTPAVDRSYPLTRLWIEWLQGKLEAEASPRPPALTDVGSGDEVALTTEVFEVEDWDRLAERLEGQPGVYGDREEGWQRIEGPEDGGRVLWALNLGEGDRLELFALTEAKAEEGRAWLQKAAGDAVRHVGRERSDPMASVDPSGPAPPSSLDLPPDVLASVEREVLRRLYAGWADEPIPVLDGRTPRQAVQTDEGREEVIRLLRGYERYEAQKAEREGKEPFDFSELWESVGLER